MKRAGRRSHDQRRPLTRRALRRLAIVAIPTGPVLHAFTWERLQSLGIAAGLRFYDASTYWSPSWTLPEGAVLTTDIAEMTATAIAIGEDAGLSPESHAATEAYLLKEHIAIATTFGEASFDDQGNYARGNASQLIFAEIAGALAPGSLPA